MPRLNPQVIDHWMLRSHTWWDKETTTNKNSSPLQWNPPKSPCDLRDLVTDFERGYLLRPASESTTIPHLQTLHLKLGDECLAAGFPVEDLIRVNPSKFKPKESLSITFCRNWEQTIFLESNIRYFNLVDTINKMLGAKCKECLMGTIIYIFLCWLGNWQEMNGYWTAARRKQDRSFDQNSQPWQNSRSIQRPMREIEISPWKEAFVPHICDTTSVFARFWTGLVNLKTDWEFPGITLRHYMNSDLLRKIHLKSFSQSITFSNSKLYNTREVNHGVY